MACAIRFQSPLHRGVQRSVHIELQLLGAVIERKSDMMPGRIRDGVGGKEDVAGAEGTESQLVVGIEIKLLTTRLPFGGGTGAEEMALGPAYGGTFYPHFQREVSCTKVVAAGTGIGHRDGIVEAVEG